MLGFAAFMMIVVVGILTLVGGLKLLSGRRDPVLPTGDSKRMEQLESAMTALESRLDDLQDQQRFLERLLADRPDPGQLPSGARPEAESEEDPDRVDSILFDTGEGEDR